MANELPPMDVLFPGANPDDLGRGPMIVGVVWALTVLAGITIIFRLLSKMNTKALSWDDWFMVAAFVCQLVDNGFMMKSYSYGSGKHDKDMTINQIINAVKWGWWWMFVGIFVSSFARISCAIFLVRIFGNRKWFKWYIVIFTFIQTASGIILLFINFVGVQPIQALWNPFVTASSPHASTRSMYAAYVAQSLYTMADLTYVVFPVAFIWQLQMALSKRLGLIAMLLMSLTTVAASIVKATRLQTVSSELSEPQYSASLATLLAGIEQTVVMMMGSLPATGAAIKLQSGVFSRLGSQISSRFGRSSKNKSSGSSSGKSWDKSKEYSGKSWNKSHGYSDIGDHHEMEPRKPMGVAASDANATYFKNGSQQNLVHPDEMRHPNNVVRTHHISVTYENRQ